jgi:hypothetical protein
MAENNQDRRKDLHAALIAFIKANKEQFAWGTSSSETGLPSYSEIAKRIDEVLESLEKTYEGVETERKNGSCKLTFATFDGTKRSFTRERDLVSWFDTITINRFIKLEGASAAENKSPIFDYISLFLGYSGFIGFKHDHRLGSGVIEELNPAAAIGERLLEQDHQKELTTTLKDRILTLVQSKATRRLVFFGFLLTIALFSTLLIRNSVVANAECNSERQLLSAIVMNFDQSGDEPFSTRLVNELRAKATNEMPLRVVSGDSYINTKSSTFKQDIKEACEDRCFSKGVVIYGNMEKEYGFVDCQIDVANLKRNDSIITEDHFYLKDPGSFAFSLPERATLVANFVWALLYYIEGEDHSTATILEGLLVDTTGTLDKSFQSSLFLLLGNAYAHLGEFESALSAYSSVSSTDRNASLADHNSEICKYLLQPQTNEFDQDSTAIAEEPLSSSLKDAKNQSNDVKDNPITISPEPLQTRLDPANGKRDHPSEEKEESNISRFRWTSNACRNMEQKFLIDHSELFRFQRNKIHGDFLDFCVDLQTDYLERVMKRVEITPLGILKGNPLKLDTLFGEIAILNICQKCRTSESECEIKFSFQGQWGQFVLAGFNIVAFDKSDQWVGRGSVFWECLLQEFGSKTLTTAASQLMEK